VSQNYKTTLLFCGGPSVATMAQQPTTKSNNHPTEEQQEEESPISVGQAAARGTLLTLLLRLVSFGCTQYTLRLVDPATLGKVNIQLELLLTTVLFISREGFRLALTRNITPANWTVAWLTLPVVTGVAGCAVAWHVWFVGSRKYGLDDDDNGTSEGDPDYFQAGLFYCLASWVEGCAEPAVLYCLRRMDIATRVKAEGLATLMKTFGTVVMLQPSLLGRILAKDWPVTALSLAQLLYAMTYAIFLYSKTFSALFPKNQSFPPWSLSYSHLDWPSISLTMVFTLQGFFKHLLTEADRIVLTAVSGNYDQGVYAMGSAYGGMAARILLQPLEENARLLWSRLAFEKQQQQQQHHKSSLSPPIDPLEESYTVLVKLVLLIGLVFSCVAVNFTHLLLNVLAGRQWGSDPQASSVLSAFCVYTAFLAGNGMTEAFVYGVTTSQLEIGRLGMAHTLTGIVFATTAPFLVSHYGAVGLVSANCVAMSVRAVYSVHFAARHFSQREHRHIQEPSSSPTPVGTTVPNVPIGKTLQRLLTAILPHPIVVACFAGAWACTKWSWARVIQHHHRSDGVGDFYQEFNVRKKEWLLLSIQHVGVGLSCVLGIASVLYAVEVNFRRSLVSMFRQQRPKQD
jgi:oligosaccharide translocation protein RFT1